MSAAMTSCQLHYWLQKAYCRSSTCSIESFTSAFAGKVYEQMVALIQSRSLELLAGPDLTDARPQANPLVRPPLPLLRGKKWKVLINLRKSENNALKVQSVKKFKSLLECPRSPRLLLPSTQKRSIARNCRNRAMLAGTELLISTGKPTEKATIENLTKHMVYVFYNNQICFFLSVLKKTNTLDLYSMCGGIKTLSTTSGPRCNSLTTAVKISHTRAKHVTWNAPKGLKLLGSRFSCFLLFQTGKNRTQLNCRVKGCEVWIPQ